MSPHYEARLFREAAAILERCCRLAECLPVAVLSGDCELTLMFDAPKVVVALAAIAGTLDPEGRTIDEETIDLAALVASQMSTVARRTS